MDKDIDSLKTILSEDRHFSEWAVHNAITLLQGNTDSNKIANIDRCYWEIGYLQTLIDKCIEYTL